MTRLSTIELQKEDMKFSSGHFTVFSSTTRENLHGHNYNLYASFTTEIEDEGLSFDYRFYKKKIYDLCRQLNQTTLLPGLCKYLSITEKGNYYHVQFSDEVIIFLKRDATIIPVTNITVEELSYWFIQQLSVNMEETEKNKVIKIMVKVFSRPGQSGSCLWEKPGTEGKEPTSHD